MTMREHEGLVGRIRQIRRAARSPDAPLNETAGDLMDGRLRALEARVAHLEQLVEGLQDSVHRQSERQGKLIAELRAQVQPGAMGAALAEDARNRGL